MNTTNDLLLTGSSLKTKVDLYKRKAKRIEEYLCKNPNEWGKFQNEFNAEINSN